MLVTCPNCGPREVQELRCAGESTSRPKTTPSQRELNEYIYFRANEAGLQREWWFCRACEDWFLAERNTVTNEVSRTWHPEPSGMSRLVPQANERIDRSQPVSFTFDGKTIDGFEGDTIGSALYASGRRVFSRSFKYHRPRGLQCCSGHCANCQMTVDGIPNVRVCTTPVRAGAAVSGQNYVGSLERDLMQATDKLGGPFTPPGFYYKTFIRPRKLWPLYEKILRNAAGLGKLDPVGARTERVDGEYRHADVLVLGGGPGGARGCDRGGREWRVGRRDRRRPGGRRRAACRPRRHRGGACSCRPGASRRRRADRARRSRSASSSRASSLLHTGISSSSSERVA